MLSALSDPIIACGEQRPCWLISFISSNTVHISTVSRNLDTRERGTLIVSEHVGLLAFTRYETGGVDLPTSRVITGRCVLNFRTMKKIV